MLHSASKILDIPVCCATHDHKNCFIYRDGITDWLCMYFESESVSNIVSKNNYIYMRVCVRVCLRVYVGSRLATIIKRVSWQQEHKTSFDLSYEINNSCSPMPASHYGIIQQHE